ncbi:hypothetical protein [Hoeflea sp.]|uniref:hypothetical protein n=1 Tax=Hoeflea sp. TaxID=1940281 RepID=UPI003A93ADB4
MDADDVRHFLEGRTIYCFQPETRSLVAVIDYGPDGRCAARFSSGEADTGVYGFDGASYWTRYKTFRDGQTHAFHLRELGPGIAQAYFADGTKAFIQSQSSDLTGLAET